MENEKITELIGDVLEFLHDIHDLKDDEYDRALSELWDVCYKHDK